MNARLFALALSALLTACVAAPLPLPKAVVKFEPAGLPLSASDTIWLFVSTEVSLSDADKAAGMHLSPIANVDSVTQGFQNGFHDLRPDVQVEVVDASLRKACFDSGTKSVEPTGTIVVTPDLSSVQCRTLIEQRGIRYLVSIGGRRHTTPRVEPDIGAQGFVVTSRRDHNFGLIAETFDTATGSSVCEGRDFRVDWSGESVVFVMFMFPVPVIRPLDESAYWARGGGETGRQVGRCFAKPVYFK